MLNKFTVIKHSDTELCEASKRLQSLKRFEKQRPSFSHLWKEQIFITDPKINISVTVC